jgi:hypothetical protein
MGDLLPRLIPSPGGSAEWLAVEAINQQLEIRLGERLSRGYSQMIYEYG